MAMMEDLGISGILPNVSGSSLLFWGGILFVCFLILLFTGIITVFFYSKKLNKKAFSNQVPIFKALNGQHFRIGLDWGKEVFVPDSNVSLFFLKGFKTYIARPTKAMGKNEYWYSISENGEWVNFVMSTDPDKNTLSNANYDHRDTRYAYINLKEIIKKNYKDKSQVWWKDPVIMNIISYVIMCIIFVGACWFLIAKMTLLIGQMGPFLDKMQIISENLANAVIESKNLNSGIVPA